VLEVEAGMVSTVEEMRVLCKWIKVFGVDDRRFRGIMVLSDANTALSLHDDVRYDLLWPGDFTEAQARQFLDASSLLTGPGHADLRGRVLSVLGTRPMHLVKLRNCLNAVPHEEDPRARVEEFLQRQLQEGRTVLGKFLQTADKGTGGVYFTGRQARALVEELVNSPAGRVSYDQGWTMRIDAQSVAAVLKVVGAHALVCDTLRSEYRFHSPAVAIAARETVAEEMRKAALAAEEAARNRRWWWPFGK
jgi:hypothetical protein